MKLNFGELLGQIVASYLRLPLAQKIAFPFFLVASMGVIIFVSRWAGAPDYTVLFSDLEQSDAAAIIERLKDQKISYRIRADGRTIDITPPDAVHELRLELASAGLPQNGNAGFELLQETTLGRTVLQEEILKLRGLQGELERTIGAIDSVKRVRVHVSQPEKSSFIKKDAPPTASVLLHLKPGAELSKQQIKGIANLVAHSVDRLTPENVTIVDSHGNMLNDSHAEQEAQGLDLTRLDYQRNFEGTLAKRIESMLAQVLGPGKAVARVNAELDFSRHEKEEENFDPGSQVARSERAVEEGSGSGTEGGVSGVVSNLSNDPNLVSAPNGGSGGNVRKESVKNFEVSRAVSKTISATGKVQKLSVAVLVDGQYTGGAEGASTAREYKPLAPEMMKQIEDLTKQAVGFDQTRGDIVTVQNLRFFEPDQSLGELFKEQEGIATIMDWVRSLAAPMLLILAFFFIVVRPLVKFLVSPTESEVDLSRLLPAGIEELEAELQAERNRVSSISEIQGPSIDIEELEELMSENSKIVKENPQQAALLIRYWINDGRM